jgi:flagellar FliJ protein
MKNTWNILSDRAQSNANDANAVVVQARARVTQLEGSTAHIAKLRLDYVERYNAAQKEAHMIADNLAYRQFIEHLQGLADRVQGQLATAQHELAQAKEAWTLAQREQAKMESMVERDARNRAQAAAKREQKQIDAAGITLFNLR